MKRVKNLVKGILRLLFTPFRRRYSRRNGVVSTEPKCEIRNEVLLGLVNESLQEGKTAIIWVKGYSMRPFIECDRDRVKLAPATHLSIGDAVLAQLSPGHYVLHRIICIEGDEVTLQGDGNLRGVEHCRRQDVCGTVVEYIRPNRVITADDRNLCRNIRLWRRLRPIRRFLLLIYKSFI